MIPIRIEGGENKAWGMIETLDPEDVARRAGVEFHEKTVSYNIRSFGMDITISPKEKIISSSSARSDMLLGTLKDFSRLSLLWYLITAKDVPETKRLIRPLDVKGGQRFFTGTHTLPLDSIAKRYGNNKELFIKKGKELGGATDNHGDASIRLYPLPRTPVYVILWLEDDEFPARADLLFDSTIDMQIDKSDIIWALAMMSVLVMI